MARSTVPRLPTTLRLSIIKGRGQFNNECPCWIAIDPSPGGMRRVPRSGHSGLLDAFTNAPKGAAGGGHGTSRLAQPNVGFSYSFHDQRLKENRDDTQTIKYAVYLQVPRQLVAQLQCIPMGELRIHTSAHKC